MRNVSFALTTPQFVAGDPLPKGVNGIIPETRIKTMSDSDRQAGPMITVKLDAAELAVRMCEARYGTRRPPGRTALQALDAMEPDCRSGWLRSAEAAFLYLIETFNNGAQNPGPLQ